MRIRWVACVLSGFSVIPSTPVAKEKLREQRDYPKDMLSQVGKGITAGKSVEDLARDIDLSRHGTFGSNAQANATSMDAAYRFLKSKGH